MRYYKLSNGNTGEVLASYARPQLDVSELVYLEEPDDPLKTVWDGEFWDYNLNKYKKNTWKELFKYIQDNLYDIIVSRRDSETPDFNSDNIAVKAKNFRDSLAGLTTKEEVDSAKESAINWAGIED